MTPAELKTRIAQILHRSDLAGQMANFIADANERINRRFGVALVVPADSEPLPAGDLLYLYASLQSAYSFLNNGDNALYYSKEWEKEADRQNVLQPGTSVDNFADAPPCITPETTA